LYLSSLCFSYYYYYNIDSCSHSNSSHCKQSKRCLERFNENEKENNVQLRTELINSHRQVNYVLLEYAEKENIDLIVVGTRGRSGFKKLLLGSIASGVVTYAHCPVLVVK
jgi:K+-sensing histidine kinase KdpD